MRVNVSYSTNVSSIVAVQLFDSNWKKIITRYENVSAGTGSRGLSIPISSSLADSDKYIWQAVLSNRSWSKLDEDIVYNVRVGGGVTSSVSMPGPPLALTTGTNATVRMNYSTSVNSIVVIQLFDSRWNRVVVRYRNVSAGTSSTTLTVPIAAGLTEDNRYIWQAMLTTRSWGKLDEAFAYNVQVTNTALTRVPLTISRHDTATLSNADATRIMADGSNVLQTNDGAGDIACDVELRRDGNVGVFNTGDGQIDTNAELAEIFDLPGNIKIVDEVDFCGGFNVNIIGCGQTPGTSFIVERFTPAQEGILWAHEYGHNVGLPHRDTTSNNVMFASIGANRERVNNAECTSMAGGIAGAISDFMTLTLAAHNEGQDLSIEEFVSQIYFDGIPLGQTDRYSSSDAVRLYAMLNDESLIQFHENIALTIGMIGDADAVSKLISYAQNGMGNDPENARAAFKGRVGAIIGLGYLLNRTGSENALNYLSYKLRPANWAGYSMQSSGASASNANKEARKLSKYAILSLGISGSEEGRQRLRGVQVQAATATEGSATGDSFAGQMSDVVGQSLELNETISRQGLLDYYKQHDH